jgi:hypothetical protein
VRVYAKHYVRQRQNNLTTFFNFNEREIIRPIIVNCCLFIYLLLLHYLFTHIARVYWLLLMLLLRGRAGYIT